MLLLDDVLGYDETALTALALVATTNPFVTAEGLPSYVGVELMAQACGAWAGVHALSRGEAVRLGFLLGTRRYSATVPWFRLGQRLEVSARITFQDQGMGVFACCIEGEGKRLAEAQLSVFQPEEGDEMLKGLKRQ